MTNAISGPVSQMLSRLIVPNECLLKTSQDSLFETDSEELPTTYDTWVTEWRRSCLGLATLVRATAGNASLCWPTPAVVDEQNNRRSDNSVVKQSERENPMRSLPITARMWRTPSGTDAEEDRSRPNLEPAARMWSTPQAFDDNDCARPQQRTYAGYRTLANDLATWRTPSATDAEGEIMDIQFASDNGLNPKIKLWDQSAGWSTPTTNNARNDFNESQSKRNSLPLNVQACLPQDQRMKHGRTLSRTLRQHSQKRLNPYFAEWLMGWSPGWTIARTGSAAWVTESLTFRRQSRSYCWSLLCSVLKGGNEVSCGGTK